jgi:hypothetical protein
MLVCLATGAKEKKTRKKKKKKQPNKQARTPEAERFGQVRLAKRQSSPHQRGRQREKGLEERGLRNPRHLHPERKDLSNYSK